MSLYFPLTPIEQLCASCAGYGRIGIDQVICTPCDGIGRSFIEGGPSFGCKLKLADCKPGQEVTLGNGERARIMQHCKRATPTTKVIRYDPMFDSWEESPTTYPSSTGVVIVQSTAWHRHPTKETGRREDLLDPLNQRTKAL